MRKVVLKQASQLKYVEDKFIQKFSYLNWPVWKVLSVGICKTDNFLFKSPKAVNIVLGHEVVCEKEVDQQKKYYVLNNEISCKECSYCKMGLYSHCEKMLELGVNENGGYAEYLEAPEESMFEIDFTDPQLGVFVEPLACVNRAVKRIHMMLKMLDLGTSAKVLIVGSGMSGKLIAYTLISQSLPIELYIYDKNSDATKWTEGRSITSITEVPPDMFHISIECSGTLEGLNISFQAARKSGGVFIYGMPPENESLPINSNQLFSKELTISSSFAGCNNETMTSAINQIKADEAFFKSLVGKEISLSDLPEEIQNKAPLPGTRTIVKI